MAEYNYPNGDLLVSASWLTQHLHDPNMRIIDARSAQDYAAGHIPGAVLLPNGAFRSTRGVPDACTSEEFAAIAGALGVHATDTVVCYDGTGGARTISAHLPLFPHAPHLLQAAFCCLSGRAQARCASQVRTVDS
jgi:3-mercaptopyruvate sulfurtransferase SseA